MLGLVALVTANVTGAAEAPVGLGTAGAFAVLGGAGVTNTGISVLNGDLGTCPTPAITGFPPGVVNGTIHATDAVACGAQSDLVIAYDDAASRAPTTTFPGPTDLVGMTLVSGVYNSPSSLALSDTMTLDAQGDAGAVFIFQAGSTLITAPNSRVSLINGAQACNVFWQIGSSATLGVGSAFVGNILALTAITANTGSVILGRLLARNASVTLDTNTITPARCAPAPTTTTSVGATTTTSAGATTTTSVGATTTTGGGATTTTSVGATTTTSGGATTTTSAGATTTTPGGDTTTTTPAGATTTAPAGATTTTSGGAGGPTTTAGGGTSTTTVAGSATTLVGARSTTTQTTTNTAAGSTTSSTVGDTGVTGGDTTAAGAAHESGETLARTGWGAGRSGARAAASIALGGFLVMVSRPRRRRGTARP